MKTVASNIDYELVVGIEVHTELSTNTKMFCACKNDPLEKRPNVNVCPICMAHPGTLPVINREAVEKVIKVGLALGGDISAFSQFDRKNYFYPDLPKGYQISQYKFPIVSGGVLNGIRITRVHLEEDAAKLMHELSPDLASGESVSVSDVKSERGTLVDYNRAGVPLMELVTEPDVRSAEEAKQFAEELRLLLRYVGASEADMEKGQLRIEANISIRPRGSETFGTKVEVKNINSFRAVEKAIHFEVKRQAEALEAGEKIKQETRGWNDVKEITVSQRSKEEANDYRYFPEPDLPPLRLTLEHGFDIEAMRASLPELPDAKRKRFIKEYNLPPKTVEFFVNDRDFAGFFEAAASELSEWLPEKTPENLEHALGLLASYLTSDFQNILVAKTASIKDTRVTPENFAELIKMLYKQEISSRVAKDLLARMFLDGSDPSDIVREENLTQTDDAGEIEAVARKIIEENPVPVADYKKGKEAAIQVLVGKVMKESRGRVNPETARRVLTNILKGV